jgi:hypothetical protein
VIEPARRSGIAGAKYPVPADDPQNIIINQNALAHATNIAKIYVEQSHGVKGAELKSVEDILDIVLTVAPTIASFASGRLTQEAFEALSRTNLVNMEKEVA